MLNRLSTILRRRSSSKNGTPSGSSPPSTASPSTNGTKATNGKATAVEPEASPPLEDPPPELQFKLSESPIDYYPPLKVIVIGAGFSGVAAGIRYGLR